MKKTRFTEEQMVTMRAGGRPACRPGGGDVAPEGGASIAAVKKLRQSGFLGKADRVLIDDTGSGYKYLSVEAEPGPGLSKARRSVT